MGSKPPGESSRTLSRSRRQSARSGRTAESTLTSIDGGYGGRGEHTASDPGSERAVAESTEHEDTPRLWHVVLSLAGRSTPLAELRRGLEQLAHDHPFLLTGRYAEDHAEIRYWEQAQDLHDAAAIALRLWGEHKASAQLPAWEIVGLEVVDRATYHKRIAEGFGDPPAFLGGVHPY